MSHHLTSRTAMAFVTSLKAQLSPEIRGLAMSCVGSVDLVAVRPGRCSAEVLGGSQTYHVELSHSADMVFASCDCSYFREKRGICHHVLAAATSVAFTSFFQGFPADKDPLLLGLLDAHRHGDPAVARQAWARRDQAVERAGKLRSWEHLIDGWGAQAGQLARPIPDPRSRRPLAMFIAVDPEKSNRSALVLRLMFQEPRNDGKPGAIKSMPLTRREAAQRLTTPHLAALSLVVGGGATVALDSWSEPEHEVPIPGEVRMPRRIAEQVLPLLAQHIPLHLVNEDGRPGAVLAFDAGPPWEMELKFVPAPDGAGLQFQPELRRNGETLAWGEVRAVTEDDLIVTGTTIAGGRIAGGRVLAEMIHEGHPVNLAPGEAMAFLERLLRLPDLPPVVSSPAVAIERVTPRLVPSVRLRADEPRLRFKDEYFADLEFDYEGRRVPLENRGSGWVVKETMQIVQRDLAAEDAACATLSELGFKFNSGWNAGPFFSLPKARMAIAVRELIRAGWFVEADGKLFRSGGEWKLAVQSGIDWFDLEGGLAFGDEVVAIPRLLAAVRQGETMIRLGDGTFGMIPEEWLKKYGGLAGLGDASGDRIRFKQSQAGLLDALLASQGEVQVDAVFRRARERLAAFDTIKPAAAPKAFVGELRPYQSEGLAWLRFLEEFGFGGCLADDMGLGKTVQVLAWLAGRKSKQASLVVAPRSLIFNWKSEIARFAPKLKVLDHSTASRAAVGAHLDDYGIVLTTYGILRRDAPQLMNHAFDVVVLDEAQMIKNRDTEAAKAARLLRANHRLALSGTPIENRLAELWSLFEFLNPGLLGAAGAFDGVAKVGSDPAALATLARAIRPFILRRTKSQVVKDLPDKTEQTLYCELDDGQRKLYDELRSHYRATLLGKIDADGLGRSKIQVLEALLRLRQAACHPGLVDPARASESSAKLDTLLEQIEEVTSEGHKVLVFSQFTSLLAIVRARLDAQKVRYEYLDGKTRNREDHVKKFRDDPECRIFLISIKAGGLGLNLVEADYVFLLDPWWNPAVEAQAIDRAHRIGQTRSVFAYRLIARDTVEEKVLQLQGQKKALADAIIQADESLIRSLTREDLELLLS